MTIRSRAILSEDNWPQLHPPLKWAGGKRWLVPILQKLYSSHRSKRLVEPFAGGLSVSLGLMPKRALINDISEHAINFYFWLKKGLQIELGMENDREHFLSMRKRFNALIKAGKSGTREAAELFYYLNRTCFNGLCRFNSSGEFNVPFGKYTKINYTRDFSAYRRVFKNWTFQARDFERLRIEKSDFVYTDPPYDVEFTRYAKNDFTWRDQLRLADWLAALKCPVVASNQATERVLRLYRKAGFTVQTVLAPRMISCDGNRAKAAEMLAFKNLQDP